MTVNDVYRKLAEHLSRLGMGFPMRDDLLEILKENLTPSEAVVALAIPNDIIPLSPESFDTIEQRVNLPREQFIQALDSLADKGMVFVGNTSDGQVGYALLQVGFGFPQTFFWKGEDTFHSRKMASMVAKYFNRQVTAEAYGTDTKPFRYIPVGKSLTPDLQAVYPLHMMEGVIDKAERIAVAHCPCRVAYKLAGRGCNHPTEVCMKFDELATFLIERGLGKEITRPEAREVLRMTEEAGLVHFVDNSEGEIKHNCNCCGCACWNVGNIKRRKIPRDALMATYFMRTTDAEQCAGCGACADICPVDAVQPTEGVQIVDEEWCIGCGVCATVCPSDAVIMKVREDKGAKLPAGTFTELHEKILKERRAKATD